MKTILVTGGTGYIGSHTTLALIQSGYKVIVLDNLSNSSPETISRISTLTGTSPAFIEGDIRNRKVLKSLFSENRISAVIHFAGLKAVGDSHHQPLNYYENNVSGTLELLQAMAAAGVFRLVFSSSATVYGDELGSPLKETDPVGKPTSPYGNSKKIIEEILFDLTKSDDSWKIAILRYFNPIGAHESGILGEAPNGIPNNLLPYISQVAIGKRHELSVFGDNYPTVDGTGVRDYIHVCDLADGHLKALSHLDSVTGADVWNLGTGKGYSVLQIVRAFEEASGIKIPYRIHERRPGDIAASWAAPEKAMKQLGWTPKRGISEMMIDTWRWQSNNPNGYSG
ncbi:UDP-glucose 4-epimerase GalE [Pseudomonas sp. abacavir_1]